MRHQALKNKSGGQGSLVRFGLVTDPHYANREMAINRYYEQSLNKLQEAVRVFNKGGLDFIVELGDLKDQGETPERNQTLQFLDTVEGSLQKFQGPVYHVLGNHDTDSISKGDFLERTQNPGHTAGRAFYSFVVKGIKFIVLDPNFNLDGSPYDRGNFDWRESRIPMSQLNWLERELEDKYPALVLVHQLLDTFSGLPCEYYVSNGNDVAKLLENSGRVLAVFQGHYHHGHYSFHRGIHYCTLRGMIEGPFPENNSFAIAEIDPTFKITLTAFGGGESRVMERRA